MPDREWEKSWESLRSRRIGAAIALAVFIVLWFAFGAIGLGAGFVVAFLAYRYLRSWPCPRCGLPITGAGFRTFVDRCTSCGLLVFGAPSDIQHPSVPNRAALTLPRRVRLFVAGYEILSGSVLVVLSMFVHTAWWGHILLEGLAAFSLGAGIWLWRDDARGYALSRTLQILQLVQIQSPWLTYVATSGVYLDLWQNGSRVGLGPGFSGTLSVAILTGQPLAVAVNLWAALLLLVLLHAQPSTPKVNLGRDSSRDVSVEPA